MTVNKKQDNTQQNSRGSLLKQKKHVQGTQIPLYFNCLRGVIQELPVAVERREHHVCRVQGMDEVWWEGVLLLDCVWSPVDK